MDIVLASQSKYRKTLLENLGLSFRCISADIDESALTQESPENMAMRLALEKARKVSKQHSQSWVIGSDQVACVSETILGKPNNHKNAINQLLHSSEKWVTFYAGLALIHGDTESVVCEQFKVKFRPLTQDLIETYLKLEQPYDCAGSFKSEGLGILLFEEMQGKDPNSLIGLPLIALNNLFAARGVTLLNQIIA
jgi:MAF protein